MVESAQHRLGGEITRSAFVASLIGVPLVAAAATATTAATAEDPHAALAALERRTGATIGLMAIEVESTDSVAYRASQRFPMASTVKVPVVMAILDRVDRGLETLDERVSFSASDLVRSYSTIADRYPHGGEMTLREVCALTIAQSDNTGVDLLFKRVGGPAGVRRYLESIGMGAIHVDRLERQLPHLGSLTDTRDSATPQAMASLMRKIALQSPLSGASTRTLVGWMKQTKTGDDRIRAAVPRIWTVADKTGSYANAANDVGLVFRPDEPPVAIAIFVYGIDIDRASPLNAAVAKIAFAHI